MEPNTIQPSPYVSRLSGPGELIKSAWQMFKTHWRILAIMAVIPSLLTLVGQLLLLSRDTSLAVVAIIAIAISVILSIAMQGALIDAVRQYSISPSVTLNVKNQFRFGFRYFWPFIFIVILQTLILLGSTLLFVIPAIIVSVYACFYNMALFIDDKRGLGALTESYSLVKGRWWGVLGRILMLGLVMFLVYIIVYILLGGLAFVFGVAGSINDGSSAANIVSMVLNVILGAAIGPFTIAYLYKLYESLKVTRMPAVSMSGFKKWLIAFMVVGIVFVASLPIFVISALSR